MAQLFCELNIVAIGGGGYNGGGSGYVSNMNVPAPHPELKIRVGRAEHDTTVGTAGEILLKASHGRQGSGGDGYSGGGYQADGGEDGGDGYGSSYGKGSGLDLSSIIMQQFSLSPGAGGKCQGSNGGGGGGVLVNGLGPNLTNPGIGEGYGGGSHAGRVSPNSGIVLLEINRKK